MKSKSRSICDRLLKEIRNGDYDDGAAFPSEPVLAARFGVARETVRKALAELSQMGLLDRRRGRSTRVVERRCRKSGLLGILVPDAPSSRILGDFVSEIMRLAKRNGYDVLLSTFPTSRPPTLQPSEPLNFQPSKLLSNQPPRRIARELVVRNVEGVIFRPFIDETLAGVNREVVRIFRNARTPVVLMDADVVEPPDRSDCDLVTVDNVAAGRKVAEHLWQRGYRKVAFMMDGKAIRRNANWRNRLFGVAGELALRKVVEAVRPLDFRPDDERALGRLFRSRSRPDAIVCGNDETAVVLVDALRKLGKRVPEDVAVVGFDDADIAASCVPPLTTVRQPSRQIAREVLRALLARISRPDDDPREVRVPATLVARATT